jgi:hypothetical protein
MNDNWSASLFTFANDNYANDPGKEGAAPSTRLGRYETKTWLASAKLENRFDIAKGYLNMYQNTGKGNWRNQPTSIPGVLENQYNEYTYFGMKAKESFNFWNGGEIITGADWDVTRGRYDDNLSTGIQNNWDGHEFTILSPYMAVNRQFGSQDGFHVTPSAGVRYYDNSDFESEWSRHDRNDLHPVTENTDHPCDRMRIFLTFGQRNGNRTAIRRRPEGGLRP